MRCRIVVCCLLAAIIPAGCGDRQQAVADAPALPPGMTRAPRTNADAAPPPVPYDSTTPRVVARAVRSWPHDTSAYTQGLLWSGNRLLEGTGLAGHSQVRDIDRTTGRVLQSVALPSPLFGEGIALYNTRVYQLTWQHHRGYVYDAERLAPIDSFAYAGEGWGLTTDGQRFYMSDGSSTVRVIDPAGFHVERTFQVTESSHPVWMLNELEWVRGELWANVYQTDLIARIDPQTGRVLGWIDVGELLTAGEREAVRAHGGVANGIAFDSAQSLVLVTGKLWPRMFEIDLRRIRE